MRWNTPPNDNTQLSVVQQINVQYLYAWVRELPPSCVALKIYYYSCESFYCLHFCRVTCSCVTITAGFKVPTLCQCGSTHQRSKRPSKWCRCISICGSHLPEDKDYSTGELQRALAQILLTKEDGQTVSPYNAVPASFKYIDAVGAST